MSNPRHTQSHVDIFVLKGQWFLTVIRVQALHCSKSMSQMLRWPIWDSLFWLDRLWQATVLSFTATFSMFFRAINGASNLILSANWWTRWRRAPVDLGDSPHVSPVCHKQRMSSQLIFSRRTNRNIPIGSMYAIYGNIYHQCTPNVSIYIYHTWILWD